MERGILIWRIVKHVVILQNITQQKPPRGVIYVMRTFGRWAHSSPTSFFLFKYSLALEFCSLSQKLHGFVIRANFLSAVAFILCPNFWSSGTYLFSEFQYLLLPCCSGDKPTQFVRQMWGAICSWLAQCLVWDLSPVVEVGCASSALALLCGFWLLWSVTELVLYLPA